MKLFTKLSMITLIVFVTICCEKENSTPVFAGSYDSQMFFREFSPGLIPTFDSTAVFKYGQDSIDIDLDNKYDLIIKQRLLFDMNVEKRGYYTYENYPYTRIELKNGLEVALKKTYNYLGHGEIQETFYVDTLNLNANVRDVGDWSGSGNIRSMWFVSPSIYQGSFGCWFKVENEIKYIGIRMKMRSDYKYGWIKLYCKSPENMRIESYAIEK